MSSHRVLATVGSLLAAVAHGQLFTVNCAPVIIERGDPILSPGLPHPSSHVHTVVGGTGFNISMSYTLAQNSKNTTCNRPFDHSNYWQPGLYSQTGNDRFDYIEFEGASIFYFNRACDYAPGRTSCPRDFKAAAPPAGLRIIAGNSTHRGPDYDPKDFAAQAIHTTCLRSDGNSATYPGLPTQSCDRMRAEVFFPSCWNGVDIDSDDHFKHMAWPVQKYNGGVCPESHPKAIYSVFYQFFYNTKPFPDWQKWVFATGDPSGYSLHGDLLLGWTNQTALEQAVYTCDGTPDKEPCSVAAGGLTPAYHLDPEYPRVPEEVGLNGPLTSLPGDHPLIGSYKDRAAALNRRAI